MEDLLAACAATIVILSKRKNKTKKKKRILQRKWQKDWIGLRENHSAYHALMNELKVSDPGGFRNFVRLSIEEFTYLTNLVAPLLQKKDTLMREALKPEEKLAVTLHFLASGKALEKSSINKYFNTLLYFKGNSYTNIHYHFRLGKSTISKFVPEVLDAIYIVLKEYIKVSLCIVSDCITCNLHINFLAFRFQ